MHPNPYRSDFISYSSSTISIWAFLTVRKHRHPLLHVHVFPTSFRTSHFPKTHINSLFLQVSDPMLFCDYTNLPVTFCCFTSFLFSIPLFIWHNIGLPDYVLIIHLPIEQKIQESWNLLIPLCKIVLHSLIQVKLALCQTNRRVTSPISVAWTKNQSPHLVSTFIFQSVHYCSLSKCSERS